MNLTWLGVPRELVDAKGLTLKGNAYHVPEDMAQGPDGTVWVLARLKYNELGTRRRCHTYFLSTYTPEGEHLWTREVPGLQQGVHERFVHPEGTLVPGMGTLHVRVAIDAEGHVILTTNLNLTFVYTPELELVRSYADAYLHDHEQHTAARNFAASIDVLPSGRWLCAVGEEVRNFHLPSIVAVSEGVPRLAEERPTLRYVTSLRPASEYEWTREPERRKGVYPYVLLDGAPFHYANRPLPTLGDCADRLMGLDEQRCTRLRALDDERFVASWAQHVLRSLRGFATNYWGFACFDARGEVIEHVDLSKQGEDHPFVPKNSPQYAYATLPSLGAIAVKNRFAAYLVRFGGEVRRVDLTEKPLKPLSNLRILGTTREGRQVWSHDTHRTLMWLDPVRDGADFEPSLLEAARGYRKAYNRVKKACPPEDGYFVV